MNNKKICAVIAHVFGLSFLIWNSSSAGVSGISLRNQCSLPQGKDMLIAPSSKASYDKWWSSDNNSVATVNKFGIVHGVSQGKTKIKAVDKNNHSESCCIVEITEPEILKNCYSAVGSVSKNENFEVCAITDKCVGGVKFKINGEGHSSNHECWNSYTDHNSKIWKTKLSMPKNGKFNINIDCYVGKGWKSCWNKGISNIIVSDNAKSSSPNLNEKRVSAGLVKYIASCEGMRSNVYTDYAGILTIGSGKVIYPYDPFYNNLSKDEIIAYFMESLNQGSYSKAVNNFLISNKIKFNQNQFDALVSFSYNLGAGWIWRGSYLKDILSNCGSKGSRTITKGRVCVDDALRLRKLPNSSSAKLKLLYNGEEVTILDNNKINGDWYKVRVNDGTQGYCCARYLQVYSEKFEGKCLNNINRDEFINEFLQYHHAASKCSSGLLSRRVQELDMFFDGKYTTYDWKYYKKSKYRLPSCTIGKF